MLKKPQAKLTPKQEAFCQAFIETGNASEAYRRAYNAEKMKAETINVKACELLKNGKVAVRVEQLQAKAKKIAEDRFEINETRILNELARCAFHRADEFFSWSATGVTIKSSAELTQDQIAAVIAVSVTPSTGKIEVKLADKLAALDKLARTFGMFKDRTEITGKEGGPIELKAQVDDFLRKLAEIARRQKETKALFEPESENSSCC